VTRAEKEARSRERHRRAECARRTAERRLSEEEDARFWVMTARHRKRAGDHSGVRHAVAAARMAWRRARDDE
jgi:hypothetical protein